MFFGAAIAHNFSLASFPAGTTANGRVAFAIAVVIVIGIAVLNTFFRRRMEGTKKSHSIIEP